jgi:SNF2 family DNA or RNA helicase
MRSFADACALLPADPPTTVFLLSMRSGAVGINLTAASHVFLMGASIASSRF